MKILTAGGVITILGNQEEARRCEDNAACAMKNVHAIEAANNEEEQEEVKPPSFEQHNKEGIIPGEHTKIPLCEDVPDRTVTIAKGLEKAEEARLIQFLRNNPDVFAWSSSDLRGVSREIMEHELRVDPKAKPHKQRLRTMSEDRKKAAQSEVAPPGLPSHSRLLAHQGGRNPAGPEQERSRIRAAVSGARRRGAGTGAAGTGPRGAGRGEGSFETAGGAPSGGAGVRKREVEDEADEWGPPGGERSCGTRLSERRRSWQDGHFACPC
jgi:hypothetical protein